MNKSEHWTKTLEIKKLIYGDYKKALDFSGSELSINDLEMVHGKIAALSIKSELISSKVLRKKCVKCSKLQFDNLITRLKMLGEIYDPYKIYIKRENKREGEFVMLL